MKLKKPRAKFILTRKCPFCCGNAHTLVSPEGKHFATECMKYACQARGPIKSTYNLAIKAWNMAGSSK